MTTKTTKTITTNVIEHGLGLFIFTSHTVCDTMRKIHASLPAHETITCALSSISGKIRELSSPTSIITDNGWEDLGGEFNLVDVTQDGDVTGDTNDIELMKTRSLSVHQGQARDLEMGLPYIEEENGWADISDVAVVWDLECGRLFDKHYRELDIKEYKNGKIVML